MLSIRRRTTSAACPLCRDALGTAEQQACSACDTSFHTACFDELGGCATLGCTQQGQKRRVFTRVERPEPRNTHLAVDPSISGWCGVWFVLELLGMIGSIAACFIG